MPSVQVLFAGLGPLTVCCLQAGGRAVRKRGGPSVICMQGGEGGSRASFQTAPLNDALQAVARCTAHGISLCISWACVCGLRLVAQARVCQSRTLVLKLQPAPLDRPTHTHTYKTRVLFAPFELGCGQGGALLQEAMLWVQKQGPSCWCKSREPFALAHTNLQLLSC